MTIEYDCSECGAAQPEIIATHEYLIEYSEEQQRWIKSTGIVVYRCCNCDAELNTHKIADILKQVGEL